MLQIKRTGIENYLPGGEASMKIMVIGGPGVGKTRWSSGWPQPIYLDVEAGLASVADLNVPYIEIGKEDSASEDMLQALKWLKNTKEGREYGTVIIDTLDAFQRKVRQEWLDQNPEAEAFSGHDAWGYLDAKMQMLLTRLLSLPQNVIVLVHYKDKTVKEKDGSNTFERTIYELQIKGSSKDEVFNDFDLVGWMDTYWKPGKEGEGRVEARGITFTSTKERWFLKDRLHITPKWLEVSLESSDLYDNYAALFERFMDRLDDLDEGGVVGEVTNVDDEGNEIPDGVEGPLDGGALPPQDPKDMPLNELTKAELIKMGRGMPSIADDVKTSLLKAELVELVEKGRKAEQEAPEPEPEPEQDEAADETEAPEAEPETEDAEASSASPPEEDVDEPEEAAEDSTPVEGDESSDEPAPEPDDEPEEVDEDPIETNEEAEDDLASDQPPADDKEENEGDEAADETLCEECGKSLEDENQDYVRLGYIKYREHLCNKHYLERKNRS